MKLVFGKQNYQIMLLGLAVLVVGFVVMSLDKEQYGFGFLGLTLGPVLVVVSFGIQFWAILYKEKVIVTPTKK